MKLAGSTTVSPSPWLLGLGIALGVAAAFFPALTLVAVLGLALSWFGYRSPSLLMAGNFAVIVFAAMAETGLSLGGIPITPSKVVVAGSLVLWGAHALARGKPVWRWHPVLSVLLVFVGSMALSLVAAGSFTLRSVHELIPMVMLTFLVGLAWTSLADADLQPLFRFVAAITVLALVLSLGWLGGSAGLHPTSPRSAGTVGDPNYWSAFVLVLTLLSLGGLVDDRHPLSRLLVFVLLVLAPLSIARSMSRAGFLAGMAMVPGCLYLLRSRKGVVALGALGAAVVLPLVADVRAIASRYATLLTALRSGARSGDGSMGERYALQQRAMELFAEQPFLGVGPGNYGIRSGLFNAQGAPKVAHNTYLQVASEQGVVGLLALTLLVVVVGRALWVGIAGARDARRRNRVVGVALALLSFGLMAGTLSLMRMPLVYLVVGFGLAVALQARADDPA